MMNKRQSINRSAGRLFSFLLQVLRGFKRNQGLLLSGAVAYYTLLSIVPASILALVVLSHFVEEQQLIQTLSQYLEMVVPGYAATLTDQVRVFIENREAVGIVGFLFMLFFSSIAFSMLENAMSVIFFQRVRFQCRNFLVSAVIPYVFLFLMGLGILLVSFIAGAIETLNSRQLIIFGLSLNLESTTRVALRILEIVGEMLMFTSIYLVMPVVRIEFRRALIGGITAAVLWEITRSILVWYYGIISVVNVIYGSIATVVVALLSLEVAVLILLLGAQVIAELEHKPGESATKKRSGFEK
jgi:YihY family inner membrane protein